MELSLVDAAAPSRELLRNLRVMRTDAEVLPESIAWQTFLELRRRQEPDATRLFLNAVRSLHSRRCIAGAELPTTDPLPDEHRLAEDAFLGDLWKAYKKCIRNHRTGPAMQLIRDMEQHLA
ncbi:MAG: hypothetical protein H6735_06885 [Alphaproteobacteria bacterium]|nr:hypothetical protein [Alphaproteobacteria bacterium]